jgi:hypothetical protein
MQRRRGSAVAATAPAPRSPPAAAAPWRRIAPAFILTYAAFAVCYLSRANAAAAKRPLAAALSLSDAALGALDALFLAAYALGNFALGVRATPLCVALRPGPADYSPCAFCFFALRGSSTVRRRTAFWPPCWP